MDRTAWIVVTLCSLGLVAWFVTQPKRPPSSESAVVQAARPPSEVPASAPTPSTSPGPAESPIAAPAVAEQTFVIDDHGIRVEFTTRGGGISTSTVPADEDFTGKYAMVLNEYGRGTIGALSAAPGQIEADHYELKSAPGATPVVFERTTPEHIVIRKEWSPVEHAADRGFLWQLKLTFRNQGTASHSAAWHLYTGAVHPLRRSDQIPCGSVWNADGEAGWDGEGFIFDGKPEPLLEKNFQQILWAGVRSQYYTTLIAHTAPLKEIPAGSLWAQRFTVDFSSHQSGTGEVFAADAGVGLPPLQLAPQQEASHSLEVFVGPRARSIFSRLDDRDGADRHFADVMFYGWWSMVSRAMLWLLTVFQKWVSGLTSSWGVAVIVLTLVVRGLLWPLTLKSTRQMKRMSMLAPQMKELQEKYKSEPQKMNAEVMRLYKRFGVNPVSGCLPVVIQIPIFFGLYRMLQSAVELRGHGIWWVEDLSMPDSAAHLPQWLPWFFSGMPVNPLPLLMTATMFVQMLMTPKSPDPNMQQQQRILLIMPLFFLFICYDFASALALYWTISNVVGIGQSWVMKKIPEPELRERALGAGDPATGGKKAGRPSFTDLFAARLAEQQKKVASKPRPPRTGGSGGSALKKQP